jgi:hypothetical protein
MEFVALELNATQVVVISIPLEPPVYLALLMRNNNLASVAISQYKFISVFINYAHINKHTVVIMVVFD